jgi:predicted AlkP superfamily pyrophosphatase or phosphodiesterase
VVGGTAKTDPKTGQQSPVALLSSTITDELRLSNNFRSKVASVCLKDRGSILPAGHIPNACYWFDDASGNWITSTYYPDSLGLPKWVRDHNARRWPDTFLNRTWEMGHPPTESFADWNFVGSYGSIPIGFPHDFAAARAKGGYGVLRYTPYGNTLVTNFAMRTIEGMELGADEWPDFLCVSYSSTDYCAHQFGIHAEETEDMYVRMDRELARLFDYLDRKFGKDNVLVFLTADHGGAETPAHLNQLRIPAGVFPENPLEDLLEKSLAQTFNVRGDLIQAVENQQIWLNWKALTALNIDPALVTRAIADQLRGQPGIYDVLTRAQVDLLPPEYPFVSELRRGIHPRRSGDMVYLLDPAWHADDKYFGKGGTTHGSPYPYDTHVPLLWYGAQIQPGRSYKPVSITDIAPTLAAILRIMEPNSTTGKIIEDVMR